MGQIEIFDLLRDKRASGDEEYFTVKQIKKMLSEAGKPSNSSVGIQAAQLEAFDYLEAVRVHKKNDHWRAFRVKKSHI